MLRDPKVSEAALAAAVVDLGDKGASDGMEMDANGRLYASDYEHNAIHARDADGRWTTVVHDPRILWPDTLSMGPGGYLYFTANQLHRQADSMAALIGGRRRTWCTARGWMPRRRPRGEVIRKRVRMPTG